MKNETPKELTIEPQRRCGKCRWWMPNVGTLKDPSVGKGYCGFFAKKRAIPYWARDDFQGEDCRVFEKSTRSWAKD